MSDNDDHGGDKTNNWKMLWWIIFIIWIIQNYINYFELVQGTEKDMKERESKRLRRMSFWIESPYRQIFWATFFVISALFQRKFFVFHSKWLHPFRSNPFAGKYRKLRWTTGTRSSKVKKVMSLPSRKEEQFSQHNSNRHTWIFLNTSLSQKLSL